MKKLILHIGSHKTGSTSMQKALFLHSKQLRNEAINPILEKQGNKEVCSNLGIFFKNNTGIDCNFIETGALVKDSFYRYLEKNHSNYGTDVLSSEEFSFITSKVQLQELFERLTLIYSEIKVLVYLRRQDKHLISHYQQASRAPGATSYIYGNEPLAIPEYNENMDLYLNYFERIGMWGDVFGDENIDIVSFDQIIASKKGLVNDFFQRIGSKNNVDEIRDNFSFGKKTTKLKHLSMQLGYTREKSFIFNDLLDGDDVKLTPSIAGAELILSKYQASNKQLVRRFGLVESNFFDFSMSYPEISNENWSELEANDVIKSLLKLLLERL